jgi:hypothetical protein
MAVFPNMHSFTRIELIYFSPDFRRLPSVKMMQRAYFIARSKYD